TTLPPPPTRPRFPYTTLFRSQKGGENMRTKFFFAAAACAVTIAGASASAALAGEVKGPPTGGSPNTNTTAGPAHANSACVYSGLDRKSTRLNSSHEWISYAVF